jgi:fatty-acyl-CoA synthase
MSTEETTPHLAYAHGASATPLIGQTIGENLATTAARFPRRDAVVSRHQGIRWSYAELDAAVDRLAAGLLSLGLERGDRVAMWSPNHAEWILMQYATARSGTVLVCVNPAYRAHELEFVLRQSGSRLLVSAPPHKTDTVALIEEVRPQLPDLERVVMLWSPEWERLREGTGGGENAVRARSASLAFDDPVSIQYTSGTTGFPKGAVLSHHNLLNNGFFVGELLGYDERDRVCVPVPFFHCFALVIGNLACTSHGSAIVVPSATFDARAVLETVAEERCTSLYGVPTMFIAELDDPSFDKFDLSSLRTGVMAGAPCPIEVMKRCISSMHLGELSICYGMTETSPVSTQTDVHDDLEKRVTTVGRVHPHIEVKVVDRAGRTLRRGERGELCTRGYSVMLGYWNEPALTAEAVDAARWMHTGDLAEMDADGYVRIVGRIKDIVIRAGENISPREVEEYLYRHPAVADVQVVGVPDERYGEELFAWVKLRPGAEATEEEIRAFCRGHIAHFKVPRYVRFTDEFPMTLSGKVQKYRLREMAAAAVGVPS